MSVAAALAMVAAMAAVGGAWDALVALERPALAGMAGRLWETLRRAGGEGRAPTDGERRRLATMATGALVAAGWLAAGPVGGGVAAFGGPALALAVLRARRRRYAQDLRRGAAEAARALADAVGAGYSARGALLVASSGLVGATGRELRAVARELELGEATERSLERLRGGRGARRGTP